MNRMVIDFYKNNLLQLESIEIFNDGIKLKDFYNGLKKANLISMYCLFANEMKLIISKTFPQIITTFNISYSLIANLLLFKCKLH